MKHTKAVACVVLALLCAVSLCSCTIVLPGAPGTSEQSSTQETEGTATRDEEQTPTQAVTPPAENDPITDGTAPTSKNTTTKQPEPTAPTTGNPTTGKPTTNKPTTGKPTTGKTPTVPTTHSKFTTLNIARLAQKSHSIAALPQSTKTVTAATVHKKTGNITFEGQVDTYTYTAPRDGRYCFELSGVKSGVIFEMYLYDELGEEIGGLAHATNGSYVIYSLEEKQTYIFKIYQYKNTGSYTLSIGEQPPTQVISAYSKVSDSTQYRGQRNTYTFTPTIDGRYRFELSGVKSGIVFQMYLYDELGEEIGGLARATNGSGTTYTGLEAGKTYTLKIFQDENFGAYTLNIGKQKETVDISSYTKISDSTEHTGQCNVYTFTPAIHGRYRFELSGVKSGIVFQMYLYDELGEEIGGLARATNGSGTTYTGLEAGKTYTLKIFQNENFGAYTLNIGKQKETVNVGSNYIVNDSVEYVQQRNVYAFTAKKSGNHTIKLSGLTGNANVELLVFNELEEKVASDTYCVNGDTLTLKNLSVGQAYEIQVRQKDGFSSYTMTIEA